MRRWTLPALALFATLLWGAGAAATDSESLVLVVHPDSGVDQLTRREVVNIFMGRHRQLPSGIAALPLDLAPEREVFYRLLTDKTLAEINAYWARLIFSGRTTPPRLSHSAAEILDLVSNNRGTIGYIRRADLDDRVKAIVELHDWQLLVPGAEP